MGSEWYILLAETKSPRPFLKSGGALNSGNLSVGLVSVAPVADSEEWISIVGDSFVLRIVGPEWGGVKLRWGSGVNYTFRLPFCCVKFRGFLGVDWFLLG